MALTISPASPVATTTADELLGHKEQLQAAFARTSAKAFPTAARDAVVTLADTTRLGDACATLAANHVSAIPVHRHDQPHNFVGVFDLLTLLNFLLDHCDTLRHCCSEEPEDLYVDLHSFTLGDLNGDSYSLLSDLVTVEEDAHLMSVLALHGDIAISTVFVRAADGHLVNGITRSDIVNALLYAVGPIRELLFQPISGLGLSLHFKTDTVAGTATLWSALQAMREKRQTAVAVVDPDGQLMGVISLLDVIALLLNKSAIRLMDQSLERCLHSRRPEAPVTALLQDSLDAIVRRLHGTQQEHVPLVDRSQRVQGYFEASDIIALFL